MSFITDFEKIAISLGFLDRLSYSGAAKRLKALQAKDPKKAADYMHSTLGRLSGINELAKKHIPKKDQALLLSPHRDSLHFKDLHEDTRRFSRIAGREMMPPKAKK